MGRRASPESKKREPAGSRSPSHLPARPRRLSASTDSLVRAPSSPRHRARARPRDARERRAGRRVVHVVASAGSGRTTAAVQFVATRPGHHAWLTLGPGDRGPRTYRPGRPCRGRWCTSTSAEACCSAVPRRSRGRISRSPSMRSSARRRAKPSRTTRSSPTSAPRFSTRSRRRGRRCDSQRGAPHGEPARPGALLAIPQGDAVLSAIRRHHLADGPGSGRVGRRRHLRRAAWRRPSGRTSAVCAARRRRTSCDTPDAEHRPHLPATPGAGCDASPGGRARTRKGRDRDLTLARAPFGAPDPRTGPATGRIA